MDSTTAQPSPEHEVIAQLADSRGLTVNQLAAEAAKHGIDPVEVLARVRPAPASDFPVGTRVRVMAPDDEQFFPGGGGRRPQAGDTGTVVPLEPGFVARKYLVSVRLDWGRVWTFTAGDLSVE